MLLSLASLFLPSWFVPKTPVTGDSNGSVNVKGSTGVSVVVTADLAGLEPITGTSGGSLNVGASSAGTIGISGSSDDSVIIADSSSGVIPITGSASASVTATVTMTGSFGVAGSSTGSAQVGVSSSATEAGSITFSGKVTVAVTSQVIDQVTGQATGSVTVLATSTQPFSLTGTASGSVVYPSDNADSAGQVSVSGTISGMVLISGTSGDDEDPFPIIRAVSVQAVALNGSASAMVSNNPIAEAFMAGNLGVSGSGDASVVVSADTSPVVGCRGTAAGSVVARGTVRERILSNIQLSLSTMRAGVDGYTTTFDVVKRRPLTRSELTYNASASVVDMAEKKDQMIGVYRCRLVVGIEFYVRLALGDVHLIEGTRVVGDVERRLLEDLTCGGNSLNLIASSNELDGAVGGERIVAGIAYFEIVYHHLAQDPRRLPGE